MEPLRPEVKRAILEQVPAASPEEIDEYERLLAESFTRDPSELQAQGDAMFREKGESRLQHLYEKLILPLQGR
jgi:hypothetical protein